MSGRKEYLRNYQRAWILKRRQEWIAEQGGTCIDCGVVENLEIDHVDASQKLITPGQLWSLAKDNPKRVAELAKCVVRCNECHLIKTKLNKEYARGENNDSKLSNEEVLEIRDKYIPSQYSYRKLAKEYGVDHSLIYLIVKRKAWKHI